MHFLLFSALWIKISDVTQYRIRRKNLEQTNISGTVLRNIGNPENKTLNRKSIHLQIPCACKQVFKNLDDILIVTRIPIGPRIMRLGDIDWLMPYDKSLRRKIKKDTAKCKNLETDALKDVQEFILYKINRMKNIIQS